MTSPGRAIDLDTAPVSRALLALVCGVLAIPGSTIAWELPAGGLWIGLPLAVAAVVLGRAARASDGGGWRARVGIALGTLCIAFMLAWWLAGAVS